MMSSILRTGRLEAVSKLFGVAPIPVFAEYQGARSVVDRVSMSDEQRRNARK